MTHTIIETMYPTNSQLRALQALSSACLKADRQSPGYPLGEKDLRHIFCVLEDGTLASALVIIPCEDSLSECIAWTLPEYRRHGFFSELLNSALERLEEQDILFSVPGNRPCPDTLAALNALGAEFYSREFAMEWTVDSLDILQNESDTDNQCGAYGEFTLCPSKETLSLWELYRKGILCGTARTEHLPGSAACLHHVEIIPELRRQGCGTALLLLLLPQLKRQGVRRVILHVSGVNKAALSLYKKTGFAVTQTLSYYLY